MTVNTCGETKQETYTSLGVEIVGEVANLTSTLSLARLLGVASRPFCWENLNEQDSDCRLSGHNGEEQDEEHTLTDCYCKSAVVCLRTKGAFSPSLLAEHGVCRTRVKRTEIVR